MFLVASATVCFSKTTCNQAADLVYNLKQLQTRHGPKLPVFLHMPNIFIEESGQVNNGKLYSSLIKMCNDYKLLMNNLSEV